MTGAIRGLTRTILGRDEVPDDDEEATPEPSTSLYTCPACDRTYISEGMNACSNCDEPVERTPTKHELGIE